MSSIDKTIHNLFGDQNITNVYKHKSRIGSYLFLAGMVSMTALGLGLLVHFASHMGGLSPAYSRPAVHYTLMGVGAGLGVITLTIGGIVYRILDMERFKHMPIELAEKQSD